MYVNKSLLCLLYKFRHRKRGAAMTSNNTLILGIGNTLLSDEGTGIHMLAYMQRHYPDLEKVEYIDGGTPGFKLAAWTSELFTLAIQ